MSNMIDGNGIQIETYAQIVQDILNGTANTPGLIQIYGTDINYASNSPDGQMINIYALSKQDILNLCVSIYNSFNPDLAVGVALDAISQISGLTRNAGTYTEVTVQIVVTLNLNLSGLDTTTPYTIQDAQGNLFYLITSASLTTGSNSINFRAANIGFVQVLANTLTTPVTIVAGVTSVNNGSTPFQVGANQETDANFRLRRQASTAFPGQGPLQALYGGLNSLPGVAQAAVYENITATTNADGIPPHGIWVVVNGGTASQIANAIYVYRSLGIPMLGGQSYIITQVDGSSFTVNWDNAVIQNLYVKATLTSISGAAIDDAAVKAGLVSNYLFKIYQAADITTLDSQIRALNPDLIASVLGVSTTSSFYSNIIYPTTKKNQFILLTANIALS